MNTKTQFKVFGVDRNALIFAALVLVIDKVYDHIVQGSRFDGNVFWGTGIFLALTIFMVLIGKLGYISIVYNDWFWPRFLGLIASAVFVYAYVMGMIDLRAKFFSAYF